MIGVTREEIYETIAYKHEIEFTYNSIRYCIESDILDRKSWVTIWKCTEEPSIIFKIENPNSGDVPRDIIEELLNAPCIEGKSVFEIEEEMVDIEVY